MRIPFFSWLLLIPIISIFLSFSLLPVSGQCLDDQQSLLLQLKKGLIFNGTSSIKLVLWNQSSDCCSWGGVTCSEGRVIGLDLSNESISGGLHNSSSIFSLHYLQNLNLAYNNFNYSPIPSDFDKLKNLSYLNLSNAGFAGQIPIAISRLRRLVILDISTLYSRALSSLKLEDPNLNMLVQNLPELIELHLDGVNISAQGSDWCQAISFSLLNLRVLSLSNCYLLGPIDSSLLNLKFLSIIRLNNNNLSTPVPEFFANFTNLTSLRLGSSGLYGTFPEKIFQVPTLEILDLSYNALLRGSLPFFARNGSLRTLVLCNTNFSGTLPDSIGNLTRLSNIDLSSCNFTGPIPSFTMAKSLTLINLAHNDLTGQITSTLWEELLDLQNIDLRYNSLDGSVPVSLFSLPLLQRLQLSNNQFSGQLHEFPDVSSYVLDTLDLSSNNLEGPIPMSIFQIRGLKVLSLSSNNVNGSFQLDVIQQMRNLSNLDLSHNNLLIQYNGTNSLLSSFPQLTTLKLASSRLKIFPDFLRNQFHLVFLDLSYNQISGEIPNWIWKLSDLRHLNLSYNYLETLEGSLLNLSSLSLLDLRSNKLQGQLPILPPSATYLDFSRNNFGSVIPASIGDSLTFAYYLSLSSNKLYGSIPGSLCNATFLQVLDLSNNRFNGTIPECLIEMSTNGGVLNLRRNNLSGTISDSFPDNCGLQTLDLNGNLLEGMLPKSLANCAKLEVLDIGNNRIEDAFPCYLNKTSKLRVLVLRSNKFHGPIGCPGPNITWPMLQIVDFASNSFTGTIPMKFFSTLKEMKDEGQSELNQLRFEVLRLGQLYYQDAVTVTFKGLERELVKILTVFTSFDFSCNNFEGPIPDEIVGLKSLYVLNLSHNVLTGKIPKSLANLRQLESLDLSSNKLTGEIPVQLADNLIFLSVLNLSFNQLVGRIPLTKQFATFSEGSYEGNKGLCGFPLKEECTLPAPTFEETHSKSGSAINWNFLSAELGSVFGLGIVIGPLMFWKRWRVWYYERVDDILFRIFPQLYLGKEYRRRRVHGQGRRRSRW